MKLLGCGELLRVSGDIFRYLAWDRVGEIPGVWGKFLYLISKSSFVSGPDRK